MKTTVEIEDGLLRQAKKAAIDRGCSLRELVEAGLRMQVPPPPKSPPKPKKMRWTTAPGPMEFPPGVDIADRRSMGAWIAQERERIKGVPS